jgi:site-specific DNA recombinase
MRCRICERKMQGSWNNGKPHYRCTFLSEYAAKNKIDHPASVYLREEQLLPQLDAWLSRKFDPIAFASAVREFEASRPDEPKPDEGAQQEITDCDAKLRQHRAALEAGADPVLVTSWIKETQARRALAEARLKKPARRRRRLTEEEILTLVTELGGIMQALKEADPADKAEVYGRLGVTLIYDPKDKRVRVEARPNLIMYVGACPRGDCTKRPMAAHGRVLASRSWRSVNTADRSDWVSRRRSRPTSLTAWAMALLARQWRHGPQLRWSARTSYS